MPTYEYHCKECGHAFEEMQSMTADALLMCPNCGKPSLKRLMTGGSGMIFKGSGFYLTDYRKGGSSEKAKEKGPAGSPKTEAKKESQPSTKSPQDGKTDTS
ncbi:MAG: zinc ribbon domain-containing protein [Ignavibacteriales bacterium]|nr:zinc ribbon domain-containing protein [Ignavibacteriales bacterium]